MDAENMKQYRAAEKRLWQHYGAQPREVFLDLERPQVRVRVQEVGEGEPLLFVHGGPNAGTTWAPLAARMQGFRCLVLDRPGCALSEAVDYDDFDLPSLATAVLQSTLDALEIERLPLVLSSMGGLWGYWLAQAHPERVSAMVQLGCPALVEGMETPTFMRLLSVPVVNRVMTRMMPASVDSARDLYLQIGHEASITAGRIPEIYFQWAYHLTAHTDTLQNELGLIEKAVTWRGSRPELVIDAEALRRVPQPTLYLWGEDDPFGDGALARKTASRTPDARLHLLPESGHLPWLDAPDEVGRRAMEFLQAESRRIEGPRSPAGAPLSAGGAS